MLAHFGTRIRSPVLLNPLHYQRLNFAQTLKMAAAEAKSKRPICPFCSKPTRICVCNRIQNPALENSVSVTILQHSLERKHPLNSTRIAKLGLKNVTVATVSDVNFEARFDIRLLEPGSGQDVLEREGFDHDLERGNVVSSRFKRFKQCPEQKIGSLIDSSEECSLRNGNSDMLDADNHLKSSNAGKNLDSQKGSEIDLEQENESSFNEGNGENGTSALEAPISSLFRQCNSGPVFSGASSVGYTSVCHENDGLQPVSSCHEEPVMTVTTGKYGVIADIACNWVHTTGHQKPKLDQILSRQSALDALAKGFVVKKMQKGELSGSIELEEYEEFELDVSPGSVLLFPSERAVSVEELQLMNLEVKNLIVLDGTWAKAKRIYNENPWLKLLPHLKLDLDKMSLYSEVRHQPRAGYLSTIESIVYALKALGENSDGLNNLLDVFESMVGDQRRCKVERLSKVSPL